MRGRMFLRITLSFKSTFHLKTGKGNWRRFKMLKAINHITVNMTDKEKSFQFYGEILGLKKLNDVDMGDHCLYYYELPGDCRLELIEYKFKSSLRSGAHTDRGVYRHFALETDDLDALKDTFVQHSVKILEGPKPSDKLGVTFMLVEDPNGVEVEFVEKF